MRIERKARTKVSRQAKTVERDMFGTLVPDPLADVDYVDGDIEGNVQREAAALSDTFSGRAKLEAQRFELATDSEFWFAVYFQNREQKERFLQAMGWTMEGDKYLNGHALAEIQQIDIGPVVQMPRPKRISKRMKQFTRQGGDD